MRLEFLWSKITEIFVVIYSFAYFNLLTIIQPFVQSSFATVLLVISFTLKTSTGANTHDFWNSLVGFGISSYSGQITHKCFNATTSNISTGNLEEKLNKTTTDDTVGRLFGENLRKKDDYVHFDPSEKAKFLRSIEDNNCTQSFNYYVSQEDLVEVSINGHGLDALTDFGKLIYNNTPAYFEYLCGDSYISSYKVGAILIISLKVEFRSVKDKENFLKSSDYELDIIKVAERFRLAPKSKVFGTVTVSAFQSGGKPSLLVDILNSNIKKCDFTDLEKCIVTVKNLTDYAKNFKSQMNETPKYAPHPYGNKSIESIGLNKSENPLVPVEKINQYRIELYEKLKNNKDLSQILKLHMKWCPNNTSVEKAKSYLNDTEKNVVLLLNPNTGGAACFNDPYRCEEIKNNIISKLSNFTTEDTDFINNSKCVKPHSNSAKHNTGYFYAYFATLTTILLFFFSNSFV